MVLKKLNLVLFILVILLALNLFFDFNDLTGSTAKENLRCRINGDFVYDADLCCHEIQKFSRCGNNKCESKNYEILFDNNLLKYCKKSDYDVRT